MSMGHATPFTKNALLTGFDGSASSEALYIPRKRITSIHAHLAMTGSPVTNGRCGALFALQYFSGAVVSGGLWSGGAWTTVVQGWVSISWNGAAGPVVTQLVSVPFTMEAEDAFTVPVVNEAYQNDPTASTRRDLAFQNTHNTTPTAGECDIRCLFLSTYGTTTDVQAVANILAAED